MDFLVMEQIELLTLFPNKILFYLENIHVAIGFW